ncbi:MAG: sialate O-acetylesterase [Planctomycetota bacterium]|jgi:sialate O-acetylesterase
MRSSALATLLAVCLLAAAAQAEVTLAGIFGDDMVLQQDAVLAIWGRAAPGERVRVTLAGRTARTEADADGRWRVELGPFRASAGRTLTVAGRNRITLHRVCIGEVWLCSGQSNMQWPVRRSAHADREIAGARDPRLRLYTVPRHVAGEPREDVQGKWAVCGPETVASFSAVAYFFGRRLRADLKIPVGLIHASWGGTPAEAWTSRAALEAAPVLRPILERWDRTLAAWPAKRAAHEARLEAWQQQAEAARAAGTKPPPRPRAPPGPDHPHRASGLFHGMIAPLRPFAIRGVIWYQGESNAGRAEQYQTLFPTLIRDWRRAWGRGDFPFLYVQLANFRAVVTEPGESAWAELRDAQRHALAEPNTAMAVAVDIGEARDIHPKNKQEVGRRLALAAQALAYAGARPRQEKVVFSGPLYESHAVRGREVVVRFRHVGGGLAARDGDALRGFAVAGADRRFLRAQARLERPVAVRYAWADNPVCNLINAEGLPASPFRTDDWPGVTAGKR